MAPLSHYFHHCQSAHQKPCPCGPFLDRVWWESQGWGQKRVMMWPKFQLWTLPWLLAFVGSLASTKEISIILLWIMWDHWNEITIKECELYQGSINVVYCSWHFGFCTTLVDGPLHMPPAYSDLCTWPDLTASRDFSEVAVNMIKSRINLLSTAHNLHELHKGISSLVVSDGWCCG